MSRNDEDCVPVITAADEETLDRVLSNPFSYVSTEGPMWRTRTQRRHLIEDLHTSHVIVQGVTGVTIGAISWKRGLTPGFYSLTITSVDDGAWDSARVESSVRYAMTLLLRSSEVRRVELQFGTYNEALLRYVVRGEQFRVEGILRDRFFVDGRYWPGVICRAELEAFRSEGPPATKIQQDLIELLRKKVIEGQMADPVQTNPYSGRPVSG